VSLIEKSIRDLLDTRIDYSKKILGSVSRAADYTVIFGVNGVGKSVVAVQMAVEATVGPIKRRKAPVGSVWPSAPRTEEI
jgi:hypothetical protein